MGPRKVAIFTGNRAEYGLQYPILKAVDNHPKLDYQLIVSGAHLDKNFGNTLEEINNDGFKIDAEVKIEMDANSLYSTAQAIGSGIIETSNALAKLKPDIMVVYADRFEGLAAVIASTQMNIPTAHIEGGDITEGGALDDSVRHAMTKLSHLHFTTNQQATNRIIGLGEEPWRVHTVGFPAIDLIAEGHFANRAEITTQLSLDFSRPLVLFSQHSVTTEFDEAVKQLEPSLLAIERLSHQGVQIIITYPNNDAGGKQIIERLQEFGGKENKNIQIYPSLGRYIYHGILALATETEIRIACAGNSSSGLKETPAFGCPTVNIGSRQKGRLRGLNVLDAAYDEMQIYSSINKCLYDEKFRNLCKTAENPYNLGGAGKKVANILSKATLNKNLIRKRMTLIGERSGEWSR